MADLPRKRFLHRFSRAEERKAPDLLANCGQQVFLTPREIAAQVISHHLSQVTVAILMSTIRLLTHDVLFLQHRKQTASSTIEERIE